MAQHPPKRLFGSYAVLSHPYRYANYTRLKTSSFALLAIFIVDCAVFAVMGVGDGLAADSQDSRALGNTASASTGVRLNAPSTATTTPTKTITPTVTATASPTPTRTGGVTPPLPTGTPVPSTPTRSATITPSATRTASATTTRTAIPTPTPSTGGSRITPTATRAPTRRANLPGDLPFKAFLPLVMQGVLTATNNGMGLERFWTYEQFRLTDRLTLFVNVWNGNLVAQYSEFAIPSRGLPLSLIHTFNSGVNISSTMGYNWTHNLGYRLVNDTMAGYSLYDGDGTQIIFNSPTFGVYISPPGNFDTLTRQGDVFTLTHKDQSKHIFALNVGGTWYLTSIQDRFGNAITLNYDASNNLIGATAAGGQTLTFSNDATTSRLTSAADNASHSFNYQYDANSGDLKSIRDPLAFTTAFTYTNHLLTTIGDPRSTQTQITYDASNRVQMITIAGKLVATFGYTVFPGLRPVRRPSGADITTFTDGDGNVTTYTLNGAGVVTQVLDPLNGTTQYTYDANYNVTQVTDALNRTTQSAYDSLGNLTIYTDTLSNATRYTYNSTNDLLSVTDPLNRLTRYGYDGVGNLKVITDALGFTTNYAYSSFGQRTSVTDANNHTTRYGYNSAGYVITTTDALNNLTQYGYDAIGNRTVITDARSNVTTFAYDANNRLLSATIPLTGTQTAVTSYGYDSVSNRTVITDALGSISFYSYDALNRLISTMIPLTGTQVALTQYGYDAVGNRSVITDANSHLTRYGYDALNRTVVITDALNNATKYGYDAVSNRTVITDALGNATRYTYDNLNRVITLTNPTGKTQGFTYDAVSNRLTSTDELTQTTRYAYDAVNRVISTTNPLTQTTRYAYDKVGNTTIITSAMLLTTTFTYYDNNWLKTKTTPIGMTQYGYDSVGNLTALTQPSLATRNFVYDKANRVVQEQDRDAGSNLIVTLSYQYDANSNRLSETESRPGNSDRVTAYTYDKANRLVATSDPNSNKTTYNYDAVGNRTGVSDPLGITTIITPTQVNLPGTVAHYQGNTLLDSTANGYDNSSRLANTTTTTGDNLSITNTLQYNGNNYLTTLALGDQGSGGSGSDSFSVAYTNANLVSGVTGIDGRPYVYDSANRLVCRDNLYTNLINPSVIVWKYDADGRRIDQYSDYQQPPLDGISCAWQLVDPNVGLHNRTQYQYSGNKLTSRSKDFYIAGSLSGHNNDSTYQYDAQGNVTQELRHDIDNNVTSTMTYTWEPATRRLLGYARDNGTSVFTTTLQYDSLNRIVARYTATYSTTYTYVGDSDWLLKETKYPFDGSPVFDLAQYRYLSPKLMRVVVGSCANAIFYVQYNWRGNYYRFYAPGGGTNTFPYYGDEWGNRWDVNPCASTPPATLAYRWNGQWGYMFFADLGPAANSTSALGLYYVHGRWYNPEVGLFLSPDKKGEYFYGSGDDAVNYAWAGDGGRLKFSMTELYARYLGRPVGESEWVYADPDWVLAHGGEWSGEIGVTISGQPYYPGQSELYWWELARKYATGKPTLIETLHETGQSAFQLLPESGVIAYGLITEAKNENVNIPVTGPRPTREQIAKVEMHLRQFGPDKPNEAMVNRLRAGNWTEYDQRFFEHETIEADFMAQGMSYDQAHLKALQLQGIQYSPGYQRYLYHPEVIRMYPEEFNRAAWP